MENLGFAATNKFIIIAVDTNLEFVLDGTTVTMPNARKVYKVADKTAIAVVGHPFKVTDIYKYILSIKEGDKSCDAIIADLESIFSTDLIKFQEQLSKVSQIIPQFNDGNGVVQQDKLFAHLENEPELLILAQEAISSMITGVELGSKIFIFSQENGRNVFAGYYTMGLNLLGGKTGTILKDNLHFNLTSAKTNLKLVEQMKIHYLQEIQPFLVAGWEDDNDKIEALKTKIKECLVKAITSLTPFKTIPRIIFYELSPNTNNTFLEPDLKLYNIDFNRKNNE